MSRERNMIKLIFDLFKQSLKKRVDPGTFCGEDYLGNKYYEIPANRRAGKRYPVRWCENQCEDPTSKKRIVPVEWDSWLTYRREFPPSEEEMRNNQALIKMKKENAAKLEEKYNEGKIEMLPPSDSDKKPFPKFEEYEQFPGQKALKENE